MSSSRVLPHNAEKRARIETFEYLSARFTYDAASGELRWKVLFPGRVAGTHASSRCITVSLERLSFKAHRICWILHYGVPPEDGLAIDHINGDWRDNRIENLRKCLNRDNAKNACVPKNNTTGYKGVRRIKGSSKYYAFICFNRKQIHLGGFEHDYEAADAYNDAAQALFGEFARLNHHKLFARSEPRNEA